MADKTIINDSPVGQQISSISGSKPVSYLVFNKQKINLVAKITIGRESDNSVVIDNKLASRHHCVIQKIQEAYYLKDEDSTNGTFLNDARIPSDKWVKLNPGDKITVGNSSMVIS